MIFEWDCDVTEFMSMCLIDYSTIQITLFTKASTIHMGSILCVQNRKKVCLNNGSYPSLLIFTQMGLNEKFSTYLNNHDGQKSVLISLSNSIVFKYLSCFSIIYIIKLCSLLCVLFHLYSLVSISCSWESNMDICFFIRNIFTQILQ